MAATAAAMKNKISGFLFTGNLGFLAIDGASH